MPDTNRAVVVGALVSGILSAISGQFSKALILGAFLPTAVFVILSLLFLVPLLPTEWPVLAPLIALDPQWKVIVLTLVTIVLSGVLYNVNIPIIRLYEGYPWKNSSVGKWQTRRQAAHFTTVSSRWAGMRTLLIKLAQGDPRYEKIAAHWFQMGQQFNHDFAARDDLILPTELGNVIRSFEFYPVHQYGIDDQTLWPRMVAKIDKEYAAVIDDAKTSFDFMLNNSFLLALLSIALLLVGLWYPQRLAAPARASMALWLLEIFIFGVAAYWLYRLSIGRASAWGDTVRASYDLYRWELLKQLGYKNTPSTVEEEYDLWNRITQRTIYGKHPLRRELDYDPPSTTIVSSSPSNVAIEILRGLTTRQDGKTFTVSTKLKNTDSLKRDAKKIIIKSAIPKGFDYEWGSFKPADVRIRGVNPYYFTIDALLHDAEVTLTYDIVPSKDGGSDIKAAVVPAEADQEITASASPDSKSSNP